MSKYELSLAKDYVPSWTVVDAVRELFQNALDQQVTVDGNDMFFSYDEQTQTLYIGNKLSVLDVKTLLLGSSTKRNDPNTIGQFGEGYKIATLVLTRLNKKVTFYNYGVKEVWNPRFVKSRRYNGAEILTFFVDKKHPWSKIPDNNLTITVENITQLEFEDIVESNLHLQDIGRTIESKYGRILEEKKYKGKVYVNGLFVCNYNEYSQGYDFKPEYIKIDRDRKLADSFELKWLSSKMLSGVDSDKTIDLIKQGAADVAYIGTAVGDYKTFKSISDKVHNSFIEEHGENAVPVIDQSDYEMLRNTEYKPILVNESYSNVIKNSQHYEEPIIKQRTRQTTKSKLEEWLKNHKQNLSKRAIKKLEDIIEELFE